MQHVMLDLETWGTVPGCAIRSVGAVMFDPYGNSVATEGPHTFYRNVDDLSNEEFGLWREQGTVDWWARQGEAAQAALLVDQRHLGAVLSDFSEWYRSVGGHNLWSHGACFDVPVLAVAHHKGGLKPPWDFRYVRDTRTLYDLTAMPPSHQVGTKHNALDDAIAQALDVQSSYRVLRDMAKVTFPGFAESQ